MTQGYTCISNSFGKIDIYMKIKYIIIKTCPKVGKTSLKCMNHQNQAILVHLMDTNEQLGTNI